MLEKMLRGNLNVIDTYSASGNVNSALVKQASKVTAATLIDEVRAAQKKVGSDEIVALCFAVFPYEVFGENDNGDSVFEKPFVPFVNNMQTLPQATTTYMDNGAVYKFHNSGSKDKSIGNIHYANYNEEQHRVELIISVSKKKGPDVYRRLKKREPILVSMGCGVEYDVCSVCGNKATTPDEHCDHIKYQLLEFVDGIPVHMINAGMVYFDISYVIVNGDINARVTYVE